MVTQKRTGNFLVECYFWVFDLREGAKLSWVLLTFSEIVLRKRTILRKKPKMITNNKRELLLPENVRVNSGKKKSEEE